MILTWYLGLSVFALLGLQTLALRRATLALRAERDRVEERQRAVLNIRRRGR